ncbi:MAG: zinc ABC transporter substrate-binding protein [Pseudomonadota bacterium]
MIRIYCTFLVFFSMLLYPQLHAVQPEAKVPSVLVSIRPLQSLAAGVMKGVGEPDLLMQVQQSPHTFFLRPSDIERIHKADLFVWVGPELEFFLDSLQKSMQHQLQIIRIEGMQLLPLNSTDHPHGHHHQSTTDPHLWLNPQNAKKFVIGFAEVLSRLDPNHVELYTANATVLAEKLDVLDAELKTALRPYQKQPFFVFHDSLQYFAKHYQLEGWHIITANPGQPLTVGQLSDNIENIKNLGVQCLFQEPQFDQSSIKTLAKHTGICVRTLDPLEAPQASTDQAYFAVMRNLAKTLITCFKQQPRTSPR